MDKTEFYRLRLLSSFFLGVLGVLGFIFSFMISLTSTARCSATDRYAASTRAIVSRLSSPLISGSRPSSNARSRSAMGPAKASGNQTSFQRGDTHLPAAGPVVVV